MMKLKSVRKRKKRTSDIEKILNRQKKLLIAIKTLRNISVTASVAYPMWIQHQSYAGDFTAKDVLLRSIGTIAIWVVMIKTMKAADKRTSDFAAEQAQMENESLKEQLEMSNQQIETLTEELEGQTIENEETEDYINRLQHAEEGKGAIIGELQKQLKEYADRVDELYDELKEKEQKLAEMQKQEEERNKREEDLKKEQNEEKSGPNPEQAANNQSTNYYNCTFNASNASNQTTDYADSRNDHSKEEQSEYIDVEYREVPNKEASQPNAENPNVIYVEPKVVDGEYKEIPEAKEADEVVETEVSERNTENAPSNDEMQKQEQLAMIANLDDAQLANLVKVYEGMFPKEGEEKAAEVTNAQPVDSADANEPLPEVETEDNERNAEDLQKYNGLSEEEFYESLEGLSDEEFLVALTKMSSQKVEDNRRHGR